MAKGFNDAQGMGFQRHMVGFVFDENKDMRYRAKVQYERFQACNPESSTWMASLTFGDDRKVLELQAADNLAFEVRKNCFNRRFDKRKERVALTRLKDRIGIIYDVDLRSLKAVGSQSQPGFNRAKQRCYSRLRRSFAKKNPRSGKR